MKREEVPNPGSDEAVAMGCICPVMDNCYGRGYLVAGSGSFCIRTNCPIHGRKRNATKSVDEETPMGKD